jgi:hypothetical protein
VHDRKGACPYPAQTNAGRKTFAESLPSPEPDGTAPCTNGTQLNHAPDTLNLSVYEGMMMDPPLLFEIMALVAVSRSCANCKCHVRGPMLAMGWCRALLSELFVTRPQEFEDYPVGEYDCDLLVWNGEVWLRLASS